MTRNSRVYHFHRGIVGIAHCGHDIGEVEPLRKVGYGAFGEFVVYRFALNIWLNFHVIVLSLVALCLYSGKCPVHKTQPMGFIAVNKSQPAKCRKQQSSHHLFYLSKTCDTFANHIVAHYRNAIVCAAFLVVWIALAAIVLRPVV